MLKGIRVGVPDEFNIVEMDDRNRKIQKMFMELLVDRGAILKRVQVPIMKFMLPFYYTLIPCEAATNLSRLDGLKYGVQPDFNDGESLRDYTDRVRSEYFGLNVKRRIILGNFLISSKIKDYNEYVRKAQRVRRLFIE